MALSLISLDSSLNTILLSFRLSMFRFPSTTLRKGDYKLIEYVKADGKAGRDVSSQGSRVTQLFNYREDPWETHNLAVFPEYQEILTSMKDGMKQAAEDLGDSKEAVEYDFDFWDYYN